MVTRSVEVVDLPLLCRRLGDDLLGEDVERRHRRLEGIEAARPHRGQEAGALDELVAGERVEPAPRRAGAGVVGPADPLEERGDRARRADLAHELHRADVDPQLERRGGHQRLQLAGPESPLDPQPAVLRQAPVVGGDHVVAEPLAQLVGQPLGQPAGVDEHDGGAVAVDVLGDPVEHVAHLGGGRHRLELAVGQLDGRRRAARRCPVSTIVQAGRPSGPVRVPTRSAATSSIGFCVADSPIRAGWIAVTWASRSSVMQRWLPRLSRASAWISSTMTVSTVRSVARLFIEVTRR